MEAEKAGNMPPCIIARSHAVRDRLPYQHLTRAYVNLPTFDGQADSSPIVHCHAKKLPEIFRHKIQNPLRGITMFQGAYL